MVTLLADGGGGGSLDWSLVSAVNGLASSLPHVVDSALAFLGEYGVPLGSVLLLLAAWARARRGKGAPVAVAGVLWAGLAAGLALLLNVPVRAMVQRPRPFVSHPGRLDLLMSHQANGSFASDHATFTMALAVGLLLVDRRLGWSGSRSPSSRASCGSSWACTTPRTSSAASRSAPRRCCCSPRSRWPC